MIDKLKRILLPVWEFIYDLTIKIFFVPNLLLCRYFKDKAAPNSVLHISNMVHIPYYSVSILRKRGIKADYMAFGTSPVWNKSDYNVIYSRIPFVRAAQEVYWFWKVAARYRIIHSHFMLTVSYSGWDLPLLKKMGRKIVVHFRGCDIRDRERNMRLHPDVNICQECDYFHKFAGKYACETARIKRKRSLVKKYGDFFIVTTPDLKDFVPEAAYLPFFTPDTDIAEKNAAPKSGALKNNGSIKVVHATNHPGIEGTRHIQEVVSRLRVKGHNIELILLRNVFHDKVLDQYRYADLSVGKMKMGYYANAQVESMYFGVPAVTFVRPGFMTDELKGSGFIFSSLKALEETLEYYLTHPEELARKKSIARESIIRLHDNERLGRYLENLYAQL